MVKIMFLIRNSLIVVIGLKDPLFRTKTDVPSWILLMRRHNDDWEVQFVHLFAL